MNTKEPNNWNFRVVYSTGGSFLTKGNSASDYIIDPVFIQFMVMCVGIFSGLMLVIDVPLVAQLILFSAALISIFVWLSLFITIHIFITRLSGKMTLYTPLLLIPTQGMNTVVMDYILVVFDPSYAEGANSLWELQVRTTIVILFLDIFHGKFVAPFHSLYVATEGGRSVPTRVHSVPLMAPVPHKEEEIDVAAPETARSLENATLDESTSSGKAELVIGKQSFDLAKVQYIRSEGHYLLIQQEETSVMLRGKLREVTAQIDLAWGLQVNRSVWAAYSAIASVNEVANSALEVVLKDGTCFRVAESRRIHFSENYELYRLK